MIRKRWPPTVRSNGSTGRIQGGTGFMREGGTERFARDARALWFVGETTQMQRDAIKRSVMPDIEFPGLFIQVPYRNSTPEEVERRITRPVEEALATLSGIEQMQSTSRDDGAEIEIRFKIGEDMAVKGVEARDKLDAIRANLPADVERVNVFKFASNDIPMLQFRIAADRDLKNSYDMLERNLKRRIERIEGVSRVDLYGVEKKEIRIELAAP